MKIVHPALAIAAAVLFVGCAGTSDDHTPIHVHVIKDGKEAKYNVEPIVAQLFNHGFKKHEEISAFFYRSALA